MLALKTFSLSVVLCVSSVFLCEINAPIDFFSLIQIQIFRISCPACVNSVLIYLFRLFKYKLRE